MITATIFMFAVLLLLLYWKSEGLADFLLWVASYVVGGALVGLLVMGLHAAASALGLP